MMRKLGLGLLFAGALIGFARDSDAFDTRTMKGPGGEDWQSIYLGQTYIPSPRGQISPATGGGRNEHSDLTELTLQQIGADRILGKAGGKTLTIVDLNASMSRIFLRNLGTRPGDNANTAN